MKNFTKSFEVQSQILEWKRQGKRISYVPTMGALHEGHLALVDEAKKLGDVVVMSIFVNPTQFAPGEDLDQYPRDLEKDRQLAESRGVDVLFFTPVEEIYPSGDQTVVVVTDLTREHEGPFRPGHFRGVVTVVTKLFLIIQPDVALFGEKDFQQLRVIRQMVKDLHFPIKIIGVPTVREPDGLAMSSRNVYLSEEGRAEARNIYASIKLAQEMLAGGERQVEKLTETIQKKIVSGSQTQLEYAVIVDPHDLKPLTILDRPARLLIAATIHGQRLIDNGPLIP